jgi:hypothetical protein
MARDVHFLGCPSTKEIAMNALVLAGPSRREKFDPKPWLDALVAIAAIVGIYLALKLFLAMLAQVLVYAAFFWALFSAMR